ncbi:MAG: SPOR domain-containing protein [Desulfarculaceae bacterium]|nr:SPOR domain-containing protein [Desulfarculaceae bacterium]
MVRKQADQRGKRPKAPQEPRSRSRWAAWLLAAFLICWAFVLGVLVGQGSLASPDQVAWVKQALGLERFFGPDTAPPAERLKDPKLKFYDRVKQQRQTAAQPAATPAPAPAKPAPKPEIKPAPQPPAKAEATPPEKPAEASGRFAVQVASFSDKEQALNLVRRLQDSGYRAYMLMVTVQGAGRRFRVRVGPYAELDAAQGAASRIRLQHKLGAYVTRSG